MAKLLASVKIRKENIRARELAFSYKKKRLHVCYSEIENLWESINSDIFWFCIYNEPIENCHLIQLSNERMFPVILTDDSKFTVFYYEVDRVLISIMDEYNICIDKKGNRNLYVTIEIEDKS